MRKVRRENQEVPINKLNTNTLRDKMMLRKSKERRISFVFISSNSFLGLQVAAT